jgi:glycine/D-amino acid oxidase-like deaminating enzyme/nitrite reductase/ring-hydroxylating ferredoxin subunit
MATISSQLGTKRKPPWFVPRMMPRCSPLQRDVTAEACVVGAGLAGLTTAYLLAREGTKVAVVDAGPIGQGETGRTTAHLVTALDRRYFELVQKHGKDGIRLIADSHRTAIDTIESVIHREQMNCDFRRMDGFLVGTGNDGNKILTRELAAAHWAGLEDVEMLPTAPHDGFRLSGCLRFPNQASFHPLKYASVLAWAVKRAGGQLFANTRITEVRGGVDAQVTAESGDRVHAKHVVVATNTPMNNMVVLHTKQAAYRTYAIGLTMPSEDSFDGLFWDTEDPFHYVRCHRPDAEANGSHHSLLIVGGEDHKTGQSDRPELERFRRLEKWTRGRFPNAGDLVHSWSGQVMETIDGLAFIGRNPSDDDNVFVATGDCGVGMTHSTIAGLLLTDLILGRNNPWTTLYDPARKPLSGAWTFAKENLNVALQYFDWLSAGDVETTADIRPGEGAVMRRGLSKVAAFRDANGLLHEMSATCPHLGCVVAWNSAEKSWDCPCHGSRFDCQGKLLHGPAITDLKTLDRDAAAASK